MSEMVNEEVRVPMPSAIVLRLQKFLESKRRSWPGKSEAAIEAEICVIDTLLGVLRHSKKVEEQYRERFIGGLERLRRNFAADDPSLDRELKNIIEGHS